MKSYLKRLLKIITAEQDVLKGLIPVCTACHKIRNENGSWIFLDQYMQNHSSVSLTHTICSDCMHKYYPMFRGKIHNFEKAYQHEE